MNTEIKYTIHFGNRKKIVVNEWLYNYFNEVKENTEKYSDLYKILSGIKKWKSK